MEKVETIWEDQIRQVRTPCSGEKKPSKPTLPLEETALSLAPLKEWFQFVENVDNFLYSVFN